MAADLFQQTNGWCCTPWGPRPNASNTQVRQFHPRQYRDVASVNAMLTAFAGMQTYDFMNASDAGTNIFIADVQSLSAANQQPDSHWLRGQKSISARTPVT